MRIDTLSLTLLVVTAMTAGAQQFEPAQPYPAHVHETIEDQPYQVGEMLYSDDFSGDLSGWVAEGDVEPRITEGRMELRTLTGLTVWFRERLEGNVLIEYERQAEAMAGEYDFCRDLNCFWQATDPEHPDDFWARSQWRNGMFGNYATLTMYYVGYGGGNNTTCRFRRYVGQAPPPEPIHHYDGNPHYLIVPTHVYRFQLVYFDGLVQFIRDGEVIFELDDPEPYESGHFGFRTTHNHEFVDNFRVWRLEPKQ
ncbi:MAG: DUF6250 domain-containing protein [Armatimonadota bacterium]